jgi:hypothetical protein
MLFQYKTLFFNLFLTWTSLVSTFPLGDASSDVIEIRQNGPQLPPSFVAVRFPAGFPNGVISVVLSSIGTQAITNAFQNSGYNVAKGLLESTTSRVNMDWWQYQRGVAFFTERYVTPNVRTTTILKFYYYADTSAEILVEVAERLASFWGGLSVFQNFEPTNDNPGWKRGTNTNNTAELTEEEKLVAEYIRSDPVPFFQDGWLEQNGFNTTKLNDEEDTKLAKRYDFCDTQYDRRWAKNLNDYGPRYTSYQTQC